jgi:putative pyrimidine permease RutG
MRYLGRAFAGDGLATVIAGLGGGTGVTTYAENIGVMAMTRVYSTVIFVVAAVVAILLGLSPKFGALVGSIPTGVIGGVVTVLFGLIAVSRRDPQRAPGRDARRAGIGPVGAALMRARRW